MKTCLDLVISPLIWLSFCVLYSLAWIGDVVFSGFMWFRGVKAATSDDCFEVAYIKLLLRNMRPGEAVHIGIIRRKE